MREHKVLIGGIHLLTAYGTGVQALEDGLFSGRHAFTRVSRFGTAPFGCSLAAQIPGLESGYGHTLADSLLEMLGHGPASLPEEIELHLASTVGEIDALNEATRECTLHSLLRKTLRHFRLRKGHVVSGACASFNLAAALAAADIRAGRKRAVLLVGFDLVSEFVFSGFASLLAMSPEPARPYDRNRNGLVLGETAGWLLLGSEEFMREQNIRPSARLAGWGISTDARHITAPDPEGISLEHAIRIAIGTGNPNEIGAVIGHGTGTKYNDAMELQALNRIFPDGIPLASAKGGAGHTLGGAGLVQAAAAIACLNRMELFPQTNLTEPEHGAEKMVSPRMQSLSSNRILSMNAGFGGLNAVLRLEAVR